VTTCGRICWKRRKINLSQVFAGPAVGVREVSDQIWLVTFMHYVLGYFDDGTCRLEPNRTAHGSAHSDFCDGVDRKHGWPNETRGATTVTGDGGVTTVTHVHQP
jgi:hypothetical protein